MVGSAPHSCSHMLKMMARMTKACIIGSRDAVIAEIIFVSCFTRPNSRTTLNARINRISQSGISDGPKSTRDMMTMTRSSQFHQLRMNLRIQFANMLNPSSMVKMTVNILLIPATKLVNSGTPSFLY
jgi:hypothetical protein